MKILKIGVLLLIAILGLIRPCFALDKNENIVTYVTINDAQAFDIEIVLSKSEEILLPVKQVADILEVPIKTNHSTKEITFQTFNNKTVKITKEDVFLDGQKINTKKNFYLKQGMMEDAKDELYADEKTLREIFQVDIRTNKNNLSVAIETEKKFSYFIEKTDEEEIRSEKAFQAYSQTVTPIKKSKISFDTLSFNNSMMSDSVKQAYLNSQNTSKMFNNNTQFSLKGTAYGGDYLLDFNTNNYTDKMFSFEGLSIKYKNKFRGYDYELGKVSGFKDENYSIGTMLIGAQIYDYDTKDTNYRNIGGEVAPKSVVNVYINDEFHSTLSTYGGYFTLKDIFLEKAPQKIALEEVKEDGEKQLLLTKTYSKRKEMLSEKECRKSVFAGISGYNDKLFSQNGSIYKMNTKKMVIGASRSYGLSEDSVFESKIVYDKIIQENQDSVWGQNFYNDRSILSTGTFRNPNTLEGVSIINAINHYVNEDLKLSATAINSVSKDTSLSNPESQNGYSITLNSQYAKKNLRLEGGVYKQSPEFYLAGSESGFISDRIGAKIGGSYTYKNFGINGGYNRYASNTDKKYDSGLAYFDEVNLGLSGQIPKIAQVRFNSNLRQGRNNVGENRSYYYDFNITRRLNDKITLELGKRENGYKTNYFEPSEENSGYDSLHSTLYAKTTISLPKNKGILELGHDVINYIANKTPAGYNMMRIGYTFPEFKRILLSCGLGYKYSGMDNGLNYSAAVGYRLKSGMIIGLNYQFDRNNGYLLDNMYIPSNLRHSINLTLNDTYAIMPSGLKSVGYGDESKGYVEISAFLDKNKNGEFDETDVAIEGVPIKLSWKNEPIYTNHRGACPIEAIESGAYKVSIDNENLIATLSSSKASKESHMIMVGKKQTTRVAFALTSSVGNITGNLKIVDDFGRDINIKDFIVVLQDEDAIEVAYSTIDDSGNYYFSGVAPGKYTVKLDETFIQNNNLMAFENKGSSSVEIPYIYKDFVDIKDVNLIYKTW